MGDQWGKDYYFLALEAAHSEKPPPEAASGHGCGDEYGLDGEEHDDADTNESQRLEIATGPGLGRCDRTHDADTD